MKLEVDEDDGIDDRVRQLNHSIMSTNYMHVYTLCPGNALADVQAATVSSRVTQPEKVCVNWSSK